MPCWNRTRPRPPHALQGVDLRAARGAPAVALAAEVDPVGTRPRFRKPRAASSKLTLTFFFMSPRSPVLMPIGAQDVAEDPVDAAEIDPLGETSSGGVERRLAEAVVHRALLGIAEDLVSGVDLLEAGLGARVFGVSVGMVLGREPAEGRLHVRVRRVPRDVQDFVRVPHARCIPFPSEVACSTRRRGWILRRFESSASSAWPRGRWALNLNKS